MLLGLSGLAFLALTAQSASGGARLAGSVTDATSGAPISGARVTLMMVVDVPQGTFGRRPSQSITDANGAFVFDGLEPGEYSVNVAKTGFAPYPNVFGEASADRLTIAAGDKRELRVALQKGAVLAGRILNAAGEPEANLHVSALKRTDKAGPIGFAQLGQSQTNDIGEFRIAGLPSGEYRLLAVSAERNPFDAVRTHAATTTAPTFFPGTTDQNAARILTLASGQTVTDLEFTIATVAARRVSGVVIDGARRPLPRAIVTLVPDLRAGAPFVPLMTIAAADGSFEIDEVVPGTYHISADVNERGDSGDFGGGAFGFATSIDVPSGPGAITVGAADVTGLTVVANQREVGR